MKSVVILSGKGGAGKSSITSSLAVAFREVVLADCDVDAPNLSLFFRTKTISSKKISTNKKAAFDMEKCSKCGICRDTCYFGAIDWHEKPVLNHKCEGCNACSIACPQGAISLKSIDNAEIRHEKTSYGFHLFSAQLEIGASGSGKVVTQVRQEAEKHRAKLMLIDAPAGIGCPVISSVTGASHAIIVAEPTISGIADMKRALDIINNFKIGYSTIINKYMGEDFGMKNIIGRIPYDRVFIDTLVNRQPVIEKKYRKEFEKIAEAISCKLSQ